VVLAKKPRVTRRAVASIASTIANTVSVIATTLNTVIDSIPVGVSPIAFGIFIQPAPRFAGIPGKANCYGQSVSALARAAAALGYPSVQALQNAIAEYCAA
jgi:YVTN family beta-propeller protein